MANRADSFDPNRGRGIFSTSDRKYLLQEIELSAGSERNARHRIRERIWNGLLDLELMWMVLPDRDFEQVFYPEDKTERHTLRAASQHAFAFLLLGLWKNRDPHPERLEDAVEQALSAADRVGVANFLIHSEPAPDGNTLLAKLKDKDEQCAELRERYESENLSESKKEELRYEYRVESRLRFLLFFKGLRDTSVDPEELAAFAPEYVDTGLTADDIREERDAVESSPLVREALPTTVDVSYGVDRASE